MVCGDVGEKLGHVLKGAVAVLPVAHIVGSGHGWGRGRRRREGSGGCNLSCEYGGDEVKV